MAIGSLGRRKPITNDKFSMTNCQWTSSIFSKQYFTKRIVWTIRIPTYLSQSFDIIIVGAGIVGAACAAECAAAGLRTLVLDRGIVGGGTTAAGMGHIVVMDDSEAQFALTEYSRRLWLQLRGQLSANVEYELCGTLWVAADEEEMAEARRKEKYYVDRNARVEILDGEGVRRVEPNLRPGLAGGLRVLDDG